MQSQNQKGFTLVEVILFFALSAGFLVIALIGISGRTANVQFTDSMRSLHSYLQSEQSKVFNGVNTSEKSACRPADDTGTVETCILIGRAVTFSNDSSTVTSTRIYGNNVDTDSFADLDSDLAKLALANPTSDGSQSNYEINWATKFNADPAKSLNQKPPTLVGTTQLGLGWLRSPDSSGIVPIAFNGNLNLSSNFLADVTNLAKGNDVATRFCFTGENDRVASINFNDNSSTTLVFDDEDCK